MQFDINAKAAPDSSLADMNLMLQDLLHDRFDLVYHRETVRETVYVISAPKGASKLKPSTGDTDMSFETRRGVATFTNTSMEELTDFLVSALKEPVLDKTQLPGKYDFAFDLAPYMSSATRMSEKEVFILALDEQDGLKLLQQTVSVEALVVEAASKVPSEN